MNTEAGLLAGAAERVITPPVGVDLTGFGDRPSGCTDIHDDLYARAVVLAAADAPPAGRVALVGADLCGLDADIVTRVRSGVEAAAGIPPDGLFLNVSHTHHGPATIRLRGLGLRHEAYVDALVGRLVAVVREAGARLAPARLRVGRAPVQIGVNRRVRTPDGRTEFGENREAAADKAVRVLRVERPDGTPVAVVFNHATHVLAVGRGNLLISSDFVGYAAARVRRALGPGVLPVFLQGCAGNINPLQGGQPTFAQAEKLGGELGEAVVTAWQAAVPLSGEPAPRPARRTLALPLADPPSPAEAAAWLERARRDLERVRATVTNRRTLAIHEGRVEWGRIMLALAQDGPRSRVRDFELQALALGDFGLVGMPGEVFFEYAQQIEAASPFRHTMVLAYHNGCIGYVPTAAAFPEGGYEVENAIWLYGTLMMKPESEGLIVRGALELLRSLRPGDDRRMPPAREG
jgi:hypothetical protein